MAIIYSYPTVQPTTDDLVLGTDVNGTGQPTKNFLISDIISLIQGGATGLGSTITANPSAADANGANQSATNFINLSGTGSVTFASFITLGGVNINGTTGVGFTNVTSTDFTGNLTGIVKIGSSIAGTANGAEGNNVLGVTQPAGTSNRTLATTAFVASRVDPSVLQYRGDATGPFDLNLVTDDLQVSGTTSEIEVTAVAVNAGNIGNIVLGFPAAGVTLPDGSLATTQAATDDSTKVATTAFVRNYDDLQDLDFSGTTGTGAVLLNNQTLAITGTANQVVTAAAGQTLTISLPATVIRNLQGNVTGILKDGSSIETTVTGVTQTAGNDSTRLATTKYVDNASGAKTLDYAGDATGPFALNLSTDDLEFNGDSNITVTAAAVTGTKGIVTIDLDNDVTITGKMEAGTLSDGTFSGSTGTYTGGVSITSALFVGPLTGNASTATALADPGTIQLLSGSGLTEGVASGASTYTDGGNLSITTSLANTTVTAKTLLNLPTPTSSAIVAGDTVLEAMAKLQGQITAAGGGGALAYEGAWRASVTAVSNGAVAGSVNLVITTADANLVKGTVVEGAGIAGTVRIDAITGTAVTLDTAITIATGITLTMSPPGGAITGAVAGTAASLTTLANKLSGRFYICDTTGKAEPNAAVPWAAATTPNEWAVGDWVVYISNGSQADQWQKIDQSNELFGSGSVNKIAKWTASNTLGTGLIEDDGTTVTIGANGNLTVLGDTILGDNAAADTITLNGPATFQSTGIFKVGIGLGGAIYGAAGQVLTSGGGSGNVNTWTTPTVGEVTSVTGLYGITVAGTTAVPTIAITSDANNLIKLATAKATPVGADTILINDSAATNVLKQATLTSIKTFTAESWILSDGTNTTTISDGDTATFAAAGTGIAVAENNGTITITGSENPGTGTALTLPVWEAGGATLGDSMVSQDAATGTVLTVAGSATFTNDVTIDNSSPELYLTPDSAKYSWMIAAQENVDQHFEITPSTAVGGTTFNAPALKINGANSAATFAGDVVIGGLVTASKNQNATSSFTFQNTDTNGTGTRTHLNATAGNRSIRLEAIHDDYSYVVSNNARMYFQTNSGSNSPLFLDGDNATVAGSITIGAGNSSIAGDLYFGTNADIFKSSGTLTITASDSTFTGNVLIEGNLTVDGAIIHSGGSSASGKGGTFTGSLGFNQGTGFHPFFSIKRPVTGSIIAQVMLTSGDSAAVSSSKVYTVAMQHSTVPVYNKLIDTGPKGSNSFDIRWRGGTTNTDTTNAASTTNTITFTGSGISFINVNGTSVSGTGIPANTVITNTQVGSSTVVLSNTVNVVSGATITFDNSDILICEADANTTNQDLSYTVDLGFDITTIATVTTAAKV